MDSKQWDQLGGCWVIHGGGAVDVTCTRDRNKKSGWVLNNNVNRADRLGCELWEKEKSPEELQDFFIKVWLIYNIVLVSGVQQNYSVMCMYTYILGFPSGASGKESACQCRRWKRHGFNLWVKKIPWKMAWQPIPVFLSGESHGQRSLEGNSPRGCKQLDMTERLSTHSN